MKFELSLVIFLAWAVSASAITIDTVPVGNPGNVGDAHPWATYGAVPYSYSIGKREVTNAEYVEFLNTVAKSDPYGLYDAKMSTRADGGIARTGLAGSYVYSVKSNVAGQGPGGSAYTYANKPVVYQSWYATIRFVNWLQNGQGSGDTETGAYTLLGGTPTPSNAENIVRNPGATWFLPNEDEWYKAAYYDPAAGIYYDYPTSTDAEPNNSLPTADTGNSANYFSTHSTTGSTNDQRPFTDVGAYAFSRSPYGTFDQGGNAFEWTETLAGSNGSRKIWGGSATWPASAMSSSARFADPPIIDFSNSFRVARILVPEPSTLVLAVGTLAALAAYRCRRGY